METKRTSVAWTKARIGDIAAFRIVREFRAGPEGKTELVDVTEEIYYLGVVDFVDKKGKALSIRVGEDFCPDQGGFNYFVPQENLDYDGVLKALDSQERYKKWMLEEIRAFLSPFLR
ncbi:MAG TPA: hypothetical protein PLA64_13845 [Mesotoga infera]|nr:hypothetical protein [Mesotoga infera]